MIKLVVCRVVDNPFEQKNLSKLRYRLLEGSWELLFDSLSQLNFRAAFVGPQGSGKSILLDDLNHTLQRMGFTTCFYKAPKKSKTWMRSFPAQLLENATERTVVLVDDAERLGLLGRLLLIRQTRRLGGLLLAAKRPVGLPIVLRTSTSPELLSSLLTELVGRESDRYHAVAMDAYKEAQGDLRLVFDQLAVRYQKAPEMLAVSNS